MYRNSLKTHFFGGVSGCVDHLVNRPLLHFECQHRSRAASRGCGLGRNGPFAKFGA
jgi:hypothetical protein